MIDVSELMYDPDFAKSYKIIRTYGKWVAGRFNPTDEKVLNFYGPVQPASTKDLEQFPEGDRQKEVMKFLCATPNEIYITHKGSEEVEGVSDIVEYKNCKYKIIQVLPWNSNGFCRAFGVKMGG